MSVDNLPSSPVAAEMVFGSVAPTEVVVPHDRVPQVISRGGQRFMLRLVFPPMAHSEVGDLLAFLQARRGRSEAFLATVPLMTTARGAAEGSPVTRQRMNDLPYSEDFREDPTTNWNHETAPDYTQGTSTTGPLTGTTAQEWHTGPAATGDGKMWDTLGDFGTFDIFSVYLKRSGSTTKVRIGLYDVTAGVDHWAEWRYISGELVYNQSVFINGNGLEDLGSGWYRVYIFIDSAKRGITGNTRQPWLNLDSAWVGVERGHYVYGALLEQSTIFQDCGTYVGTSGTAVSGASQTGRTLYTDGWTGSSVPLKAGDVFTLGSGSVKLYMVQSDATSVDAFGNSTLTITPPLMDSIPGNVTLTHASPTIRLALVSDGVVIPTTKPDHYRVTIDAVEVVQ